MCLSVRLAPARDGSLMKYTSVLLYVSTQSTFMTHPRSGFTMVQLPHSVLELPFSQTAACVVIIKSFSNVPQSDQTTLMWPEVLGDLMFWHVLMAEWKLPILIAISKLLRLR